MPPKAKPGAPSKKTEAKKKEKIIEDKTFGLKNKKGAKQQRFIQQVEKQVKSGGVHPARTEETRKAEKEKKLKEQKELALLFKPVQTQKIEKGADPKSIICILFKQGICTKGAKCKFSHDLAIERKAEKRSLYVDMRDDGDPEDTMENWTEEKLKEVIEKKHGENEKKMPTTDIICKHFLKAVETSKYGWFWECPSGTKCIYRHALPPGFVLKKDKKKDDKRNEISLEDLIERERAALGPAQTKITLETFLAWKKKKLQEKSDAAKKEEEKRRNDYKAGRQVGLSGREMFSFNPDLVADDEMEDGDEVVSYSRVDDDGEENTIEYRELNLDLITLEASEVDGTGTTAKEDRLKVPNGAAGVDDNTATTSATNVNDELSVPINENLFLDEDLESLEEELNDLEM